MHRLPFDCLSRRGAWLLTVLSLTLGSGPGVAGAASDLNLEMAKVAEQIKLLLNEKGQKAIAVGEFRGRAGLASSAGPAIAKALDDELKNRAVTVTRRAELEVNGEYRDDEDDKTKLTTVRIKAHVVDRAGNEVVAFEPRGIVNVATIAALIGVTVAMPADATDEQRDDKLTDAIDNPKVHLAAASTRIAASADSPYAIEVLVHSSDGNRPLAASKDKDGFAFVKLSRDELYAVKLINDSPYDAAVALTIDGLSVFAFSDNPSYTHWMVASKKTLTVRGWHRTNTVSDLFKITDYARSAVAEKLSSAASVGTITAAFSAAWPKGSPPPDDEPPAKKGEHAGDATGRGPAIETHFTELVRDIGRLRASVSVRYTKEDAPKNLPASQPR